jgi:hypothetical protein
MLDDCAASALASNKLDATRAIAKGMHILESDHAKSAHELAFSLSSRCGNALKAARSSSTSQIFTAVQAPGRGHTFLTKAILAL